MEFHQNQFSRYFLNFLKFDFNWFRRSEKSAWESNLLYVVNEIVGKSDFEIFDHSREGRTGHHLKKIQRNPLLSKSHHDPLNLITFIHMKFKVLLLMQTHICKSKPDAISWSVSEGHVKSFFFKTFVVDPTLMVENMTIFAPIFFHRVQRVNRDFDICTFMDSFLSQANSLLRLKMIEAIKFLLNINKGIHIKYFKFVKIIRNK